MKPSDQTLLIDGYTSKATYGTGDLSAYYSQFVSAGSYPMNSNGSTLLGKFSQSGNLLSAQYHPLISSLAITRYLVYRDQFGNQYKIGDLLLLILLYSSRSMAFNPCDR
ncbi:hypothetical protein EJ377_10975 [Chryseobacterium arthrosphaerae]|uniref:Uncharacterized protein n=1 Tax=Chryseobacterium arthrosphaerae TaxID=651561 RepID=A0A432E1L5_9FLAO|nr:hypothetical protein EJ377_10975 [Chryseobacterium arthrosphaerae]